MEAEEEEEWRKRSLYLPLVWRWQMEEAAVLEEDASAVASAKRADAAAAEDERSLGQLTGCLGEVETEGVDAAMEMRIW